MASCDAHTRYTPSSFLPWVIFSKKHMSTETGQVVAVGDAKTGDLKATDAAKNDLDQALAAIESLFAAKFSETSEAACREYHIRMLNEALVAACANRSPVSIPKYLVQLGATDLQGAILAFLRTSQNNVDMINLVESWVKDRASCLDLVAIIKTAAERRSVSTNFFVSTWKAQVGPLGTKPNYATMLNDAAAMGLADVVRDALRVVKDPSILNEALNHAAASNQASVVMMTSIVMMLAEGGATDLYPALKLACAAADEGGIYEWITRGVKPTAECLDVLLKPFEPEHFTSDAQNKMARIVTRLVECGVPFPAADTQAHTVIKKMESNLKKRGATVCAWLNPVSAAASAATEVTSAAAATTTTESQ